MGKVVNLRTVRKQKRREDDRQKTDSATSGSALAPAAERARARQEAERAKRALDAHRRDEPRD